MIEKLLKRRLMPSLDFDVIPKAANWLNVAGMICSLSLLISYLVLPVKQTSRHYLTVGLVVAICIMQVCQESPLIRQDAHEASWVSSFLSPRSLRSATMLLLRMTCIRISRALFQVPSYCLAVFAV